MELTGPWLIHPADETLQRDFPRPEADDANWRPAQVPGHWATGGVIRADDTAAFYRHHFEAPTNLAGSRRWLRLDGIFYQSDVWMDGHYLGDTEGYFFPHQFEITNLTELRTEHLLAIEVNSSSAPANARRELFGAFHDPRMVDAGWNPGGIWRSVHVVETGPVAIRFFRAICTDADATSATITLHAVVTTPEAKTVKIETTYDGYRHEHSQPLAAGENRVDWTFPVPDPQLWWPASLGDQPLGNLDVRILLDDGSESDHRHRRMGMRSVKLRDWVFAVNGEKLFTKGANVGPTRQDLAAATVAEVVGDLQAGVEAGLDLLRVHTHIARPELYDAADELGMLLWQDLPLHGNFARSVRTQARRQAREAVDLLGHHPSIVLWCGHDDPTPRNPDEQFPTASLATHQRPGWNRSVLDRTLKNVLQEVDPSRPVIAHSGVLPHFPQIDGTDAHLWFGWRSDRAADLADFIARWPRLARFVSMFGAQSVPEDAAFCEPDRWPDLDWHRLQAEFGYDRVSTEARVPPGLYESFVDWQKATQDYQARVVKTTIELLRRVKYRPVGGFCQYFLADSRPSISYSLLGHDRRPKPAFQALVDACRPVIVVADPIAEHAHVGEALSLDVHVISELRDAVVGAEIKAELTVDGEKRTWRWGGDIPADDVVLVGTVTWPALDADANVALDLELTSGSATATNRYFQRISVEVDH